MTGNKWLISDRVNAPIEALHEFIDCLQTKQFEPVYPTVKMVCCSLFVINYSDITSETNGSVGAVITLLLNAFEQSAIITVSYVIYLVQRSFL